MASKAEYQAKAIEKMEQKPGGLLLIRVIRQLGNQDIADMAASISYYSLLSVFPLLLGAIGMLGIIFPSEVVQKALFAFFQNSMPTSADLLQENVTSIIELRGTLGFVGLIGLFWTGSALFACMGRVTDRIWGFSKHRSFLSRKLRELMFGAGAGAALFISATLAAIPALFPEATLPFGIPPTAAVTQIIIFLLVFTVFLIIYKYMPNTRVDWKDVRVWAFLGAAAFEFIRNLFTWYLDQFANLQMIYGSIASVIAFLVWIYISAFVLIIGMQFVAESAKMRNERKSQ